jgi:anti-sigma B factor antagonist
MEPMSCREDERMIDMNTTTERLAGGIQIVSVAGELDVYTVPALERELLAAVGGGAEAVIVDLTECEFLDSTALGVLLSARTALADSHDGLSLVIRDRNILRVFEIAGGETLFAIHATRAAAMNGGLAVDSWEDKEAKTRTVFRIVNERIAEVGFDLTGRAGFVCECGNRECSRTIELTRVEYENVRAHARHFLLAPDHEDPTVEIVIRDGDRFAVAETLVGRASRIPEETDPRPHRTQS